ncbi:TetR/AcrR family transcriptional regulator [Bacillus salinus]|uniref:TetR/AcrR family transcriptional regulator n=1 Tax=Bacillus sp. HMF5848 TaxID=2495421 RepID=UPI00163B4B4C|nr:TetR/AcrR family transcriptional regulator [Bacillus sp. HMF5848]
MKNKMKKSEETKNKLMECAKELFYRKGFDKTTVREIVESAEVAQGTFYLYFEAKEEVLYQIVRKELNVFKYFISMLEFENPKLEDIDLIIDSLVHHMEQDPKTVKLLHDADILEMMNFSKSIEEEFFQINLIEQWLKAAMKRGLIQPKEPYLYAKIITHIIHELVESAFLYNYPDHIDVIKEEVKVIIKKILVN